MKGRVFEIREFTLHDGPGVRTTVFLKGCPLRCAWCHNPEGQSFGFETMRLADGSERLVGEDWDSEDLARELAKNADIMAASGGGITFSGGEPLAQPEFVEDTIRAFRGLVGRDVTVALETSGAVAAAVYRRLVPQFDFVYQDLKHHDGETFRNWTGGELSVVLDNIAFLRQCGVEFVLRVVKIPGVNDSAADAEAFEGIAAGAKIEYLPYNPMAGAKYPQLGRKYFR